MSVGLVLAATDGLLVVADGREVAVGGNRHGPVWVSDTALKIATSADGAPVVAVGVGIVAVQHAGAEREVLAICNDITSSPRPEFGLAAGEGPWTAKALTHHAAHVIDDDGGAFLHHRVLALVVDWQAGVPGPDPWKLAVGSLDADGIDVPRDDDDPEPSEGKTWVTYASAASQVHSFPHLGFFAIPDGRRSDGITYRSEVVQLLWNTFDRSVELRDNVAVDVTDMAWHNTYRLSGLNIAEVRRTVEDILSRLVAEHADTFRLCHVGGYWTFATVRRDGLVTVEEGVPLGPMHGPDGW